MGGASPYNLRLLHISMIISAKVTFTMSSATYLHIYVIILTSISILYHSTNFPQGISFHSAAYSKQKKVICVGLYTLENLKKSEL